MDLHLKNSIESYNSLGWKGP